MGYNRKNKMKKVSILFMIFSLSTFGVSAQSFDRLSSISDKETFCPIGISVDQMNVLYVGIPNTVTITAAIAPENLYINWGGSNATSLGGGRYNVIVPPSLSGKELTISVLADVGDGKIPKMGETKFRVKNVPEPSVFVGGNITGGKQTKDAILANPILTAKMSPDFNFELRWTVTYYKATVIKGGIENAPIVINGGRFNDQLISMIKSATSGTIVEFSDININSEAGKRTIQRPLCIRIR
ncbi:MAG: hypothetical protein J5606_02300 [Bacteroidales bacterium]|nr:hypothetical protein [Bacteroidales bacterium]